MRIKIACIEHATPCNVNKRLRSLIFILAFFLPLLSYSQKITVTGTVTDETNKPVASASVRLKESTQGTTTDNNGRFSLQTGTQKGTLIISYVGYLDQEVPYSGNANLSVKITPGGNSGQEVVVIGYGTRRKEAITGSVATITTKDISNVYSGSQVSNTLAGKLPGVTFRQPDGRPGAAATIQIRNFGPALYVIDGVQSDVITFNSLVATDIESISILKDASAAIYGLRGANGVVLVTTKHGKPNEKPTINANYSYGLQNLFRYDKVLTNSYDYMRYKAEADINSSTSGNVYGTTTITDDELAKYKQGTDFGYQSFDWKNYVIKKNSPLINTNINASGGSDKITYYVSANNIFQNSLLGREYTYRRSNIQTNITAKIANGLKIGAEIYGSKEQTRNPGVPGVDDYFQGLFAVLRNTPLERPFANDNPKYLNHISNDESNWGYDDFTHAGSYQDQFWRIRANLTAEYQVPFVKGLSISGFYSYYWINQLLNNHEFTYDTYTYNPVDTSYTRTGGSTNPWRERRQTNDYTVSTNIKLDYNHKFGNHSIEATLVNERINEHYLMDWVHSVPPLNSLSLIYFPQADTYTDVDNQIARIGYIARISYGYEDKYFIDLNGRRDLSSLFPPGHRVGYFPSASGSWRISKENFFQNITSKRVLSDLKLRGSYGILGQDALTVNTDENSGGVGNYVPIQDFFSYISGYNYNVGSAIFSGQLVPGSRDKGAPVTNITWLKNQTLDLGLDFSLLNNSLSGTFDYFKRIQKGLLAPRYDLLLPSELGYSLPNENLNSQTIAGYEMSLSYIGNTGKLNYRVGGNFSYARSKNDYVYKPRFNNSIDQYFSSDAEPGRYVDKTWGYISTGQFQSQDQINNYPVDIDGKGNRTLLPGDLIYKDLNGDGKIDQNDERPIGTGTGQPLFNFGLNISLSYQNFDFTASFSGAAGYTWTQQYESLWPFQNGGNLNTIFEDRWHKEDFRDPNSPWIPGKYPALRFNPGSNGQSNYSTTSTFWTHNVKYFRARTIEIGYSFSKDWMRRVGASRARIFVNSYNLFSLDNLKQYNIDPEINATNSLQYPQTKNFNFGFNLTF